MLTRAYINRSDLRILTTDERRRVYESVLDDLRLFDRHAGSQTLYVCLLMKTYIFRTVLPDSYCMTYLSSSEVIECAGMFEEVDAYRPADKAVGVAWFPEGDHESRIDMVKDILKKYR